MTKADEQAKSYAQEAATQKEWEEVANGTDALNWCCPSVRDYIMGTGCFSREEEVKMHRRVGSKIAEQASKAFREEFEKQFSGSQRPQSLTQFTPSKPVETLSHEQAMALKAAIAYFKRAETEREAVNGHKYRVGTVTSPAYGMVDLVGELEGILERFAERPVK